MISRVTKVLSHLGTPAALLVIVVILGMSFVAVVLVPGLELASEVADSSTALKLLGDATAPSDPHPRGSRVRA